MYHAFSANVERDKSPMETIQAHTSVKLDQSRMEAAPRPWRGQQEQKLMRDRKPAATPNASYFKDGTSTDTDSDYEYVSNAMRKSDRSTINTQIETNEKIQPKKENTCHDSICEERSHQDCSQRMMEENEGYMKLIRETMEPASQNYEHRHNGENNECNIVCEQSFRQDCFHRRTEDHEGYTKLIRETMEPASQNCEHQHGCENKERDSVCEESSRQDCFHRRTEDNDGYMKLIRETMEPASQNHEYQKLDKDTMEPPLEKWHRCRRRQHYMLWAQIDYDLDLTCNIRD